MDHNKKILASLALALPALAYPATTIDGSGILRDIRRLEQGDLSPALPAPAAPEAEPNTTPEQASVQVSGFVFEGATLVAQNQLQQALAPLVGKTLNYQALQAATRTISRLYHSQGWLAKVYLPPQEINNGIVRIAITEAQLGKIETQHSGAQGAIETRVNQPYVLKIAERLQQTDAPLNSQQLERALLLINDIPGVKGRAILSAGAQAAQTNVTLALEDKPIFNANAWVDNFGSPYLGKARWHGAGSFNNISGWGDQLSFHAFTARGIDFLQGDINLPLGYAGTRFKFGGRVSNYTLLGDLSKLKAQGDTNTVYATIMHPWLRSRAANVYVQATFDQTHVQEEALDLEIADKQYRAFTVAFKADHIDTLGMGGMLYGGLSATFGDLDLSGNRDNKNIDASTVRTDGHYEKLNFYIGRKQTLSENLSAGAVLSAQLASTNLGGLEKFSLGGPFGLKGFANGEAAADQGWMLNLQARYAFTPQLSASVMGDAGGVCQYKRTWAGWNAGNAKLENCYQLGSAGLGLDYINAHFNVQLSYQHALSSNPGLDSKGRDIEGESKRQQLWLQIGTNF